MSADVAGAAVDTCPTPAEADYFREVISRFQKQTTYLKALTDRDSELRHNPNRIFDDDWRGNVLFLLTELELGSDYLMGINGPESTVAIQRTLALRAEAMQEFVALYRNVVVAAAMNPAGVPGNPMEAAGNAMREVIRHTNAVGEQGKGFCSQSSSPPAETDPVMPPSSYTRRPPPPPPTATATGVVWLFCSGVLRERMPAQHQVAAVYRLDESELREHRQQTLAVVRLLRRQVDQGTLRSLAGVREMREACREVPRANQGR